MLFATINGEKVEAIPKTIGMCPLCKNNVFSKCGEINVWHWANQKDESCDNWYEPETEWHKSWKLAFGKNNSEIIIAQDGVKHIADIVTSEGVIIELQNSPIPKQTVFERENFYGERMIWVINGKHFKNNFSICPPTLTFKEEWYWRNEVYQTEYGTVDKETGELVSQPKKDFTFSWRWPRKAWVDLQRHLFIDFGDKNLFWVIDGMGTNQGTGRQVSKERFLKKYGGDIEFLEKFIYKKD